MRDFVYRNPAQIIFGKGCEANVGTEISKYGTKALIVLGGAFIKDNGLYDRVSDSLGKKGIEHYELDNIMPNPRLSKVKEGIALCREKQIDFVLAIGGGSAIDTAKTISAGVLCKGEVWDYFENFTRSITKALPLGVILTLPATGSECSNCAIITKDDTNLKRSLFTDYIIPKFAMLNPEMSFSLPPYQTACGTMDMLSHLLEMYFTPEKQVDLTDRLLEGAMKTILHYAPLALSNPLNYDVRAELFLAANITNNGLLSVGRAGGDWGSHNIEHEISGIYNIAHGAGMAVIFPAWMKYCWKRDVDKFVQLSTRVFDVDYGAGREEWTIQTGIQRLEAFIVSLGLPVRLSKAGIGDDRLKEMAHNAMIDRTGVGIYLTLEEKDILEILKLAAN